MEGRAQTVRQKREVIEKLMKAWVRLPDLRLGQLLTNALGDRDLFYIEDDALALAASTYAFMFSTAPDKEGDGDGAQD